MRIRQPGKIRDRLWLLGCEESCIYLLEGRDGHMIISAGMSYIVDDVLRQLGEFGIDEGSITKLLILHAHFDHAGVAPFFKRRHPELEIYASGRGWEILEMPKAIKTINEFSRSIAKRMGREDVYSRYDLDWRDDIEGLPVSEGDSIDLGDLEVRIYETPGHSSCSISAYVPKMKALFASDGMGIPHGDRIFTSGNSNFTQYQQSLEKLKELDVAYACADHYGYIAGDEAKDYILKSIHAAREHRTLIEETYLRTKDMEVAAKELVTIFFRENPGYIISPEILEQVYVQKIRHIAHAMETDERS
ncbi:MAG: MBL fold metallo-hydrolase [Pseudomonadota bacterium]